MQKWKVTGNVTNACKWIEALPKKSKQQLSGQTNVLDKRQKMQ